MRVERETDDGRVVADRVANLSASEREVVGIVLALAGYRVHDVHEDVPVVVLDGVEAIDADRLAALLEYIAEHAPYLIAAVLPGDADAAALEEGFPGAVMEV